MELKPAKRKKYSPPGNNLLFPLADQKPFTAEFLGSTCYVRNKQEMTLLFNMGFYGKGNLSKSEPTFNGRDLPEILPEQQWENRKNYDNKFNSWYKTAEPTNENHQTEIALKSIRKFLDGVLRPSDLSWQKYKEDKIIKTTKTNCCLLPQWTATSSDVNCDESKLKEMVDQILIEGRPLERQSEKAAYVVLVVGHDGPRLENCTTAPLEMLQLNLQETFFLAWALGKLNVLDKFGKLLTVHDMWVLFQVAEDKFIERYVVYHWYRSRGWVIRSGLKYGGDFILYEKGPSYYHSSYLIRIHDDHESIMWDDLARQHRLVETVRKDIIYCSVVPPEDLKRDEWTSPDVIAKFRIREVMCRRWIPYQQRT